MRLTAPPPLAPGSVVTATALVAAQAALLPSWQAVHERLSACAATGLAATSLADLAVYFHCVYQAFGRPGDGALARQLAQRLAAQPWPGPGRPWAALQVEQACALAWLHAQAPAAGLAPVGPPAQLAAFDEALYRQAQGLLAQPGPGGRAMLVRVARYLRLRLPAPTAGRYLRTLLGCWPPVLPPEAIEPLALGLVDGLAAELLGLMRVHQAGVQHPLIQARVQQGVRGLLAVKRAVDFLERDYSVFPYELGAPAQGGVFSAELSWQRGDAGQAWLLYEAQAILHDQELANIAELVGLNTILRTSGPATRVASAGFYCGAAGVAQLYAQLYRTSGLPAYRAAYHFWLGRTQELLPAELARPLAAPPSEARPLEGLVGIGLVLLTATQEVASDWQAILV